MEQNQEKPQRDYTTEREKYKNEKAVIAEVIEIHKRAIWKLEQKIVQLRPKTENGKRECKHCDCISMKYFGRTPQGGLAGGDDVYECEICHRYNIMDY